MFLEIVKMELFYCTPEQINGQHIVLDGFEAKHIVKTLRKKQGESVDVTDGCGNHYVGTITTLKPHVQLLIKSKVHHSIAAQKLALGLGFIRPNRLEIALEKCCELGVSDFYLFKSTYANYFSDNNERFEKILRQAIKQSNRFFLPRLHLLPNFNSFLTASHAFKNKIAAIDPQSSALGRIGSFEGDTLFCVGPEGGFSVDEVCQLKDEGFMDVALGNARLRAETAAIAGISLLGL